MSFFPAVACGLKTRRVKKRAWSDKQRGLRKREAGSRCGSRCLWGEKGRGEEGGGKLRCQKQGQRKKETRAFFCTYDMTRGVLSCFFSSNSFHPTQQCTMK